MDIGVIAACLLLLALCGYFVARPLLTLQNATAGDVGIRQLNERKEQIYASIIELTFDNELDKLPDADFQRMRGELEAQALSILEQLDQLGQQQSGENIEQYDNDVAAGEVIGINTAIFSKSGGSQGIGFAIPVKLAMEVMQAIIEHGQVIRGYLGVEVQPLTPELAESFGLEGRPGIVVAGVYRDGPAQRAGLQPGDLILSIDGEAASDGRRSMNQVARTKPGDKIRIEVLRNGKQLDLTAEIGIRPPANGN